MDSHAVIVIKEKIEELKKEREKLKQTKLADFDSICSAMNKIREVEKELITCNELSAGIVKAEENVPINEPELKTT